MDIYSVALTTLLLCVETTTNGCVIYHDIVKAFDK